MSFNYENIHGGNNGFIYRNKLAEELIGQFEQRQKTKMLK